MKNRIISVILGLVMIMSLLPTVAMAGEMKDAGRRSNAFSGSYKEYNAPFNDYDHGMTFDAYDRHDTSYQSYNRNSYKPYKNRYNQKKVITDVAVTITEPVIGQAADYAPTVTSTPEGGISDCKVTWVKIPMFRGFGSFFSPCGFGTMRSNETFKDGYYYLAMFSMSTYGTGYIASDFVSGTVNGYPNVAIYGSMKKNDYNLFMCAIFEASEVQEEHTHSYEMKNDETNHWQECECGDIIDSENHSFGDWTITKEATYKEVGSQERTCTVCGYVETEEIPVIEHEHEFVYVVDEDGHHQLCEVCGDTTEVEEHTFGEWNVTKEATYTETGMQEHECTLCGFSEEEEIPVVPHEHEYAYVIDEDGHHQVCGICDDTTETEEHTFDEWIITKEATYTETGMQKHECTLCGFTEEEEIPVIPHEHEYSYVIDETSHYQVCDICGDTTEAEEHTFGDWDVTTEATYKTSGMQEHACTACGYVETEEIPVIAHDHNFEYVTDETSHHQLCTLCGDETEAEDHVFGDWTVTTEATRTEEGLQERTCEICGYTESEVIPADPEEITSVAASIVAPSYGQTFDFAPSLEVSPEYGIASYDVSWYKIPSESYTGSESDPMYEVSSDEIFTVGYYYVMQISMSLDDGFVVSDEIIGSINGLSNVYGSVKQDDKTIVLNAVFEPHVHEYVYESDETNHWKQCECGDIIETAEHTFGDWVTTQVANTYQEGIEERSCTECGYTETNILPMVDLEHIHIFTTKYDETQHWKECRCEETKDYEEHTFGDWVVVKAATATKNGKQQRQCTGCNYKETAVIPATGESITHD